MEVSTIIYELTKTFPDEQKFGLTSQMRRAAVSIPSNIAEGSGRNAAKEFCHHLGIAAGSACELFTQVLLAEAFKYISEEKRESVNAELGYILNMIYRLPDSQS